MTERILTCICCPMGCQLTVKPDEQGKLKVEGNTCKRGEVYGIKECTNPTRIVTTTVLAEGGNAHVLSVKTESDIDKDKIFDVIKSLRTVKVKAPVHIGDVILENAAGTGTNVIATKNIEKESSP